MIPKEAAYIIIEDLVTRFEEQLASYKKADYNETLTRRDFIDPFFKALGWDMDNSQGNAEAYREVIHEDKIKIGAATKAPDYSFKLAGGKRLFFVEAKKPSVVVKDEVMPAYQIRRYAWSAKLPISILTDFEEFAIYDCNKKPNPTDKPSVSRIKYLTYKDYLKEFDFIWDTFSKERVLKGSFDKFIAADKNKKGTATVDREFLTSLDEWRKQLALNIALRNEALNEDELNFVVQQTLDRIIFLRIAEDRGVEEYGRLQHLLKGEDYYANLLTYFKEADAKYNSGLFDFKKDTVSRRVVIDNKTIKAIINELYYPISPYEFSVLSVEILGSAYEQFLGKQIKLSPGHRASIEEKPEVRKAGGVYYTPEYIVEYIVKNTVGKLTDGKKPADVAKFKIVDPACGSGSFLLGAYQFLLTWHLQYYMPDFEKLTATAQNSKDYNEKQRNDALKERNKLPLTPTGSLTSALKKQILLNNIYGVDIDTQAVEVTKLSLLLKCMEGETGSSITAEMNFGERILPTLDSNIKSGNSLIDMDFYDGLLDFEPALEKKVKPFSWEKSFAHVFKQGGFDCVIGNPPYRMMQPKDTEVSILNYFKNNYNVAEFKIDLFHLFFQKAVRISRDKGLIGFITPSSLLNNVYAQILRSWLLDNCRLNIIALSKNKIFADADVYTAVYILEKNSDVTKTNKHLIKTNIELENLETRDELNYSLVKQERFRKTEGLVWNILINESNIRLLEKIIAASNSLNDVAKINRGLITGDKSKYFANSKVSENHVPIFAGADVFRYSTNEVSEYVLFEKPKTAGGCWDKEVHFANHKILIRQIGFTPTATLIEKPIAVTGNIFTVMADSIINLKYFLGLINSKLIEYFWKINFSDFKNSFPQVTIFSLNQIPIKKINPAKKSEKSLHDEIVQLVTTMLQLQQQKQNATLPEQVQQLEQRIAYTDDKINEKVYELYGLSKEEVGVVEGR